MKGQGRKVKVGSSRRGDLAKKVSEGSSKVKVGRSWRGNKRKKVNKILNIVNVQGTFC